MRQPKAEEYLSGNLTAMIDVVFQLIIFFVCTVKMQEDASDKLIKLAPAPHGMPAVIRAKEEVIVNVTDRGRISIAHSPLTVSELRGVLRNVVSMTGTRTSVTIKADGDCRHADVQKVMDACAAVSIRKIRICALKEKAG